MHPWPGVVVYNGGDGVCMRFTALIFVQVLFLLMGFGTGCDSDLSPVDSGFDNEDVIGILISPEKVILPLGESVQLTATGLLENRTSRDLTPYVTWLTADASIAGVSNGLDQEGQVTGKAIGGTLVRAKLDEVTSTDVQIEVTEAELVGLAIEPKSITVQEGQSVPAQSHRSIFGWTTVGCLVAGSMGDQRRLRRTVVIRRKVEWY